MIRSILFNGRAGLIDLNILQKQQLLEARCYYYQHEDYASFRLYGKPREGQSLEEVEQLLLSQIERLKEGKFPDWLMDAVIKDYQLSELRGNESNRNRVEFMTNVFILGVSWERATHHLDELKRTKQRRHHQICT